MSEFTNHSFNSAPAESKPLLKQTEQKLGFTPNLIAVMAESPATLESYLSLSSLFDKTAFNATERQLILLTISRYRNCCYCLAAHGSIAKMQKVPTEIIDAVYYNQSTNNENLDALRSFTRAVLEAQGWVKADVLNDFYKAGYKQQHVLEVILGISFKTLSNFINHINDTAIDKQFLVGLPETNKDSCCCSTE